MFFVQDDTVYELDGWEEYINWSDTLLLKNETIFLTKKNTLILQKTNKGIDSSRTALTTDQVKQWIKLSNGSIKRAMFIFIM